MKIPSLLSKVTWLALTTALVLCVAWELWWVIFQDPSVKPALYVINAVCLPVNTFNLIRFVKLYEYMWNGNV